MIIKLQANTTVALKYKNTCIIKIEKTLQLKTRVTCRFCARKLNNSGCSSKDGNISQPKRMNAKGLTVGL
jgi:hypothetical protein